MADPQTWDIERGTYGHPNMSCSYNLSWRSCAALATIHGQGWPNAPPNGGEMVADEVGPTANGSPKARIMAMSPGTSSSMPSPPARGFHDFTNDPRSEAALYFAKTQTPRDPQRKNLRASGAWGVEQRRQRRVFGVAARMTAKAIPPFRSHAMDWSELGFPVFMGDGRLGGFEPTTGPPLPPSPAGPRSVSQPRRILPRRLQHPQESFLIFSPYRLPSEPRHLDAASADFAMVRPRKPVALLQ